MVEPSQTEQLLEQLRAAPTSNLSVFELFELIKQAHDEIERLAQYEWMYKDLCE
jgi:hypothetical protein